jgi:peptidoglycan L-alanyl-D-glutamate endopeptidase CwlK
MADGRRSAEISLLHPVIREPVVEVVERLRERNIPLRRFETWRSPFRQAELYARGRSKTAPWKTMKIVTYAKAWQGPHLYGLGVDFQPHYDGRWQFVANEEWTAALREIGKPLGLVPIVGKEGKLLDPPHLQWTRWNQGDCLTGNYPSGYDDAWEENLDAAIAAWGFGPKTILGIRHPSAPPFVGGHPGVES